MASTKIKGTAILWGIGSDNRTVLQQVVRLDDYYQGEHPWDSSANIAKLGMVSLRGLLFASDGQIQSEFENRYDSTGKIIATWARHQDGTVHQRTMPN